MKKPPQAGAFALFFEELDGVFRAWAGKNLAIEGPEFTEHRELMQLLNEVRGRMRRLVPRTQPKSGQHSGVVVRFWRERGLAVAQLESGAFVPFHLTAYMGSRGARLPHRGTQVRIVFSEHQGRGVVLAVHDEG